MKLQLAFLAAAALAHAHFVFVVPEPGGAKAKVFISETLSPTQEVDVAIIRGAQLQLRDSSGKETVLELVRSGDAYEFPINGQGNRLVHGLVDFGFAQMGNAKKPYLLMYHPKTIVGDAFSSTTKLGEDVAVEIVPTGKPGALTLQLLVRGKPQPGAEITVILPDGSQRKLKTDAQGQTETLTATGRYGAWARYWDPVSGERDGKKYEEIRHYATLVIDTTSAPAVTAFAKPLPEATSSFGAAVSDGWLYIYGGHIATTHTYSTASVSGRFHRFNLSGNGAWEDLPAGPPLQGMNIAAYQGKIYRIGGMAPQNKPGEPTANYSTADCARFDPATKKWEPLPPLPQPRSSHDVVVIDGKLIVTGGWNLQGPRNEWPDTTLVLDLKTSALEWKSLKQPFKRRALMAAAYRGKMYVVGGIDDKDKISSDVSIFDPATGTWSDAPKIPGMAFAPAVGVQDKSLYVSVADGSMYRLNEASQQWDKTGTTTARVAHRLAVTGQNILIIGGAAKGKNFDLIEVLSPL